MILYPLLSVGVLMLSIELTGKQRTLNDLLALNYMLHKIDQQPEIQITLPDKTHEKRIEEVNKIYEALAQYETRRGDTNRTYWCLHNLFLFLLFNFEKNKLGIETFNKSRFHLFTYFQIDTSVGQNDVGAGFTPAPVSAQNGTELIRDFIRIARCQNKKYKVLPNLLENNEIYMKTFENIYIASCAEGACMMIDSFGDDSVFFSDFKNFPFLSRYLWIYLLVYVQKSTLNGFTKMLTNINTETAIDSNETLVKKLEDFETKLSKMKMNIFTDISDHTQHNDFYKFCFDKLFVKKHFDEVGDKIRELQKQDTIEKHQKFMASVEYAKLIQNAVMPNSQRMNEIHPDHFLLLKPLDIVSGDFYWATMKDDKSVIAAVDCTGHGVPGAFMSMLGISFLNEIVLKQEIITPGEILDKLYNNVKLTLQQTGAIGEQRDGMDMAFCMIDYKNRQMQYAGANRPLYLIRNGELIEYKADRMPAGIFSGNFTNNEITLQPNDMLYIFSDGYIDQHGGERNTTFKTKPFKDLLIKISTLPTQRQKEILLETHNEWKGELFQTDDIIVMGIRIN